MFELLQANMPKFETKKALIITNMQNDTFHFRQGLAICGPEEFRDNIQKIVPCFRRMGDIVWIRTEFGVPDSQGSPSPAPSAKQAEDVNETSTARLTIHEPTDSELTSNFIDGETIRGYFPDSRTRAKMRKMPEKERAEFRETEALNYLSDDDAHRNKPRRGKSTTVYAPGTRGAEFTPDTLANINELKDIILVKNHYSAFDATALLVSLRMKLVTHLYLAGSLSNISIYATAADAVRHGFKVSVIKDCIGHRNDEKHKDAMKKMVNAMGVSETDSIEVIEESGGEIPPDAAPTLFSGPGIEGIRSGAGVTDKVSSQIAAHLRTSTVGASLKRPSRTLASPEGSPEPEKSVSPRRSPQSHADAHEMEGVERTAASTLRRPGDRIGEGDSAIIHRALSKSLAENAFKLVRDEVDWQVMRHKNGEVPRRVAVQGEYGNQGAEPLYRHPADETPPFHTFTTTVQKIRDELQILLKQPFNHCLIQLYRSGQDNISEHSDKVCLLERC